jgi:hypothetical protein
LPEAAVNTAQAAQKQPKCSSITLGNAQTEFFETEMSNYTAGNINRHLKDPIFMTASEAKPLEPSQFPDSGAPQDLTNGENHCHNELEDYLSPQKSPEHLKLPYNASVSALRYFSSKKKSMCRQSQSPNRHPYAFSHQKSLRQRKEEEVSNNPSALTPQPMFKSTVQTHQAFNPSTIPKPHVSASVANGQRLFGRISLNDPFGDTWSTFTGTNATRTRPQIDLAKKYRDKPRFSRPSELLLTHKMENNNKASNILRNIYSGEKRKETDFQESIGSKGLGQVEDVEALQFLSSGPQKGTKTLGLGFPSSSTLGPYLPGRRRVATDFTVQKSSHKTDFRAYL